MAHYVALVALLRREKCLGMGRKAEDVHGGKVVFTERVTLSSFALALLA
jgi:hypothetical protein